MKCCKGCYKDLSKVGCNNKKENFVCSLYEVENFLCQASKVVKSIKLCSLFK